MRRLGRWLPSIVWMGIIYYLSSQTGDDLGGWLSQIQRLIPFMEGFDWGHFVSYFLLALTFAWALERRNLSWGHKALVVLFCVLYGITDEFHQSFIPGRTPDVMDLRNDAIGAALAMLFVTIPAIRHRFEQRAGAKYY
jgi:VanZ family protein